MTETVKRDVEKLRTGLNTIIVALMCSSTLTPAVIFYTTGPGKFTWLMIFVVVSYLMSRLPKSFYDRFQISTDMQVYRKMGVHQFKRFATNGDIINNRIRARYPSFRNVTNFESLKKKLNETYFVEKSHTVLFVFCLLTSLYAFWAAAYTTAVIIFIGNVVFNWYPNLLQQYNRVRYTRIVTNYPRR
jgi:hypothetical protein